MIRLTFLINSLAPYGAETFVLRHAQHASRERFAPTIGLIEKHCEVVNVDGGVDYRLRQLIAAPIYLPSGDPATQKKLEELFDDLSDEDVESGHDISVNNRKIKVVRESENVIWFEFSALCEGPRSAADSI